MLVRDRSLQTTIRTAVPNDYPEMAGLLATVNLLTIGVRHHLSNFLVLKKSHKLIGVVGLEIYGEKALLRSLAVAQDYQGRGYGHKLVEAIMEKARRMNLSELFLLTETADTFFATIGFETIPRKLADEQVQTSDEFSYLCPSSATCMRVSLI